MVNLGEEIRGGFSKKMWVWRDKRSPQRHCSRNSPGCSQNSKKEMSWPGGSKGVRMRHEGLEGGWIILDLKNLGEEFRCYLKFNRKLLKEAGEEHDLVFIF